VVLPRYLSYLVLGGITGLLGPRGDLKASRLGDGRKASNLTVENIYCYEISNRNRQMDLSKTTFTTFKDNGV
jgi:hypothetical protein